MRSGMNDTSAYIHSFDLISGTWDEINEILSGAGKDKAFYVTANLFKMFVSDDYHAWYFPVFYYSINISYLYPSQRVRRFYNRQFLFPTHCTITIFP